MAFQVHTLERFISIHASGEQKYCCTPNFAKPCQVLTFEEAIKAFPSGISSPFSQLQINPSPAAWCTQATIKKKYFPGSPVPSSPRAANAALENCFRSSCAEKMTHTAAEESSSKAVHSPSRKQDLEPNWSGFPTYLFHWAHIAELGQGQQQQHLLPAASHRGTSPGSGRT